MATLYCNSSDGTRIAYDDTGRGPAIILLHGARRTRRDWHTIGYVSRLVPQYRVITVDLRGTGESAHPTLISDYSVDKLCSDVVSAADACDLSRFSVCGYGLGANIARYLAAGSERVRALVVIGIPFGPAVHTEFARRIDSLAAKWTPILEQYGRGARDEISSSDLLEIENGDLSVWLARSQAMRNYPVVQPTDIHCPVLLLAGSENSSTTGWIATHQTALRNAGTCVRIVQGLDHAGEFTDIDCVFPPIDSFLTTIGEDK